MASDVEGLYAAVKALVCVVKSNPLASKEMERIKGYQVGKKSDIADLVDWISEQLNIYTSGCLKIAFYLLYVVSIAVLSLPYYQLNNINKLLWMLWFERERANGFKSVMLFQLLCWSWECIKQKNEFLLQCWSLCVFHCGVHMCSMLEAGKFWKQCPLVCICVLAHFMPQTEGIKSRTDRPPLHFLPTTTWNESEPPVSKASSQRISKWSWTGFWGQAASVMLLREMPLLDIYKAATWSSVHAFAKHYAFVQDSSTGASFETEFSSAIYNLTLASYLSTACQSPTVEYTKGPALEEGESCLLYSN